MPLERPRAEQRKWWIIGIVGVVRILQRDIIWGAALIVLALLIGPGGVSIFT